MYITTVIMSVFALLSSSTSTNGNTNTNGTLASSSDSANTQTFLLDNFVLHDPSGEPGNYIRTLNFDVSAADSADKDDDDKASNDDASDAKNHALVHCAASWDYRMDGYPRGYVPCNSSEWNWYVSSWKESAFELEVLRIWDPENELREYHHRFAHVRLSQDDAECTYGGSGASSCDWGALNATVYNETVNALV